MLGEFSIAGIYLPPFLAYVGLAALLFFPLRALLAEMLGHVWHPALFEFALSLVLLSLLVLYV